jgi:4-carboxymuconolactone decarboxylase
MTARLAPLEPPYEPEIASALDRLMGGFDVEPLRLFRTIAHHPQLLDRFRSTGSTLLSFGTVDPRDRETVIHRTTARCGAGYEWGVHATLFAADRGEDWLRNTWEGDPEDFDDRDAPLVRLADQLHDTGHVDDDLWATLGERYPAEQLVELVCLVGFYHLVSFICGAFAVEPESWAISASS